MLIYSTGATSQSRLSLYTSSGTGGARVYVGEGVGWGGGILYDDYITLFNKSYGNADYWTARNYVTSNDWEFKGDVKSATMTTTTVNVDGDLFMRSLPPTDTSSLNKTIYFDVIDDNGYANIPDATPLGRIKFRINENDDYIVGTVPTFQDYSMIQGEVDSTTGGALGGALQGALSFWTRSDGVTGTTGLQQRMTIRHNGNVGIGTNAPSVKLEVVGDVNFYDKIVTNGSTTTLTNTQNKLTANGTTTTYNLLYCGDTSSGSTSIDNQYNQLQTQGNYGSNRMYANGTNGVNLLSATGGNGENRLNAGKINDIQIGSVSKIKVESATTTISNNVINLTTTAIDCDIRVNNVPLLTQIYGFFQPSTTLQTTGYLIHSPIIDQNDGSTGFISPVDIKPYSISISIEDDGDSSTDLSDFSFYVKVSTIANEKRSDLYSFHSTNTNAGQLIFNGVGGLDRLQARWGVLTSPVVIPAGRPFGIYYTKTSAAIAPFSSEISLKLFCSQV
jgi:hypothetical protein